jgi:hypothetical protein
MGWSMMGGPVTKIVYIVLSILSKILILVGLIMAMLWPYNSYYKKDTGKGDKFKKAFLGLFIPGVFFAILCHFG